MKKDIVRKKTTKVAKVTKSQHPIVRSAGLTVDVFDLQGRKVGKATLPKAVFGQVPNLRLLAQAVRVYLANANPHTAHTKTRAEVRGGGVKPWRQKGTGHARAGSRRSPLWVGGGRVFGPRTKDVKLTMPQKAKHKALIHALSAKAKSGQVKVVANIEKVPPKTKLIANLLEKISAKGPTLLVIAEKNENVKLASRNISQVSVDLVQNLNAYEVLKNNQLLISREAVNSFK